MPPTLQFLKQAARSAAGAILLALTGTSSGALIGHWKFDEDSGTTAADSSSNGNLATTSADSWTPGVSGSAADQPRYTLADSSDLNLSGTVPVTISLWAKTSAAHSFTILAGFEGTGNTGDIYGLKLESGKVRLTGPNLDSPDTLQNYSAGSWVHIVGVNEPGVGSRIYIDGEEVSSGAAGDFPVRENIQWTMGTYWNSNSYNFNGSLDDVQIYDEALTAGEVATLFASPGIPFGSGPPVIMMGPPSAETITDAGATVASQLFNAAADTATLVWAKSDAGETDVSTWTSAAGGGSNPFGAASKDEVLSHAIAGLDGDTTYFYRFLATAGADSDWSTAGSFATGLGSEPAPSSPSGTAGTNTTRTKVDLSWTDSYASETGFLIQRSTDPGFGGTPEEFSVAADATSFTDDTTDPNTTYFYRIAAAGSTGMGAFSSNLKVTTGDAPVAGLIGHWTFDEGTGATAADSSGNGYDANQSVVAGEWVAGKAGNAYSLPRFSLDAAGSEAVKNGGGSAVTLSAWVTTRTGTSFEGIAGFENTGMGNDVYSLKMDNADKINWTVDGNAIIISPDTLTNYAAATVDGWVHVVGVFEQGSTHTLYVNGAPVVSGANANAIQNDTSTFAIGSYQGANSYAFSGSIDDVQVYSLALSADDVALMFNNPGSSIGDAAPFAITEIEYDPFAIPHPTVTLTWLKTGAASYIARYSFDMRNWGADLDDDITPDEDVRPEDTEHITMTFSLEDDRAGAANLFFRIEEG